MQRAVSLVREPVERWGRHGCGLPGKKKMRYGSPALREASGGGRVRRVGANSAKKKNRKGGGRDCIKPRKE